MSSEHEGTSDDSSDDRECALPIPDTKTSKEFKKKSGKALDLKDLIRHPQTGLRALLQKGDKKDVLKFCRQHGGTARGRDLLTKALNEQIDSDWNHLSHQHDEDDAIAEVTNLYARYTGLIGETNIFLAFNCMYLTSLSRSLVGRRPFLEALLEVAVERRKGLDSPDAERVEKVQGVLRSLSTTLKAEELEAMNQLYLRGIETFYTTQVPSQLGKDDYWRWVEERLELEDCLAEAISGSVAMKTMVEGMMVRILMEPETVLEQPMRGIGALLKAGDARSDDLCRMAKLYCTKIPEKSVSILTNALKKHVGNELDSLSLNHSEADAMTGAMETYERDSALLANASSHLLVACGTTFMSCLSRSVEGRRPILEVMLEVAVKGRRGELLGSDAERVERVQGFLRQLATNLKDEEMKSVKTIYRRDLLAYYSEPMTEMLVKDELAKDGYWGRVEKRFELESSLLKAIGGNSAVRAETELLLIQVLIVPETVLQHSVTGLGALLKPWSVKPDELRLMAKVFHRIETAEEKCLAEFAISCLGNELKRVTTDQGRKLLLSPTADPNVVHDAQIHDFIEWHRECGRTIVECFDGRGMCGAILRTACEAGFEDALAALFPSLPHSVFTRFCHLLENEDEPEPDLVSQCTTVPVAALPFFAKQLKTNLKRSGMDLLTSSAVDVPTILQQLHRCYELVDKLFRGAGVLLSALDESCLELFYVNSNGDPMSASPIPDRVGAEAVETMAAFAVKYYRHEDCSRCASFAGDLFRKIPALEAYLHQHLERIYLDALRSYYDGKVVQKMTAGERFFPWVLERRNFEAGLALSVLPAEATRIKAAQRVDEILLETTTFQVTQRPDLGLVPLVAAGKVEAVWNLLRVWKSLPGAECVFVEVTRNHVMSEGRSILAATAEQGAALDKLINLYYRLERFIRTQVEGFRRHLDLLPSCEALLSAVAAGFEDVMLLPGVQGDTLLHLLKKASIEEIRECRSTFNPPSPSTKARMVWLQLLPNAFSEILTEYLDDFKRILTASSEEKTRGMGDRFPDDYLEWMERIYEFEPKTVAKPLFNSAKILIGDGAATTQATLPRSTTDGKCEETQMSASKRIRQILNEELTVTAKPVILNTGFGFGAMLKGNQTERLRLIWSCFKHISSVATPLLVGELKRALEEELSDAHSDSDDLLDFVAELERKYRKFVRKYFDCSIEMSSALEAVIENALVLERERRLSEGDMLTYMEWAEAWQAAWTRSVEGRTSGRLRHMLQLLNRVFLQETSTYLIFHSEFGFGTVLRDWSTFPEDQDRTQALLRRLFNLFHRIPQPEAVGLMAQELKQRVIVEGEALMKSFCEADCSNGAAQVDKQLVENLFGLFDRYETLVALLFANDVAMQEALKAGFEAFVNGKLSRKETKPNCAEVVVKETSFAEVLAIYADSVLRREFRDIDAEAEDERLEKIVNLFTFLKEKDVFQEFCKAKLAKRFLQTTPNEVLEKGFLEKLQLEMGLTFTAKMKGMHHDCGNAKGIAEDFQKDESAKGLTTEFHCQVLTAGNWPAYPSDSLEPHRSLRQCMNAFSIFYKKKFATRTLNWIHMLGSSTLLISFPKGPKDVLCSTYQATILCLVDEFGTISAQDIAKNMKLDLAKTVRANIASMYISKNFPLLVCVDGDTGAEKPVSKTIADTDLFKMNPAFQFKIRKFKLPAPIQPVETASGMPQREDIDARRKAMIDACIVRVMKSRKELPYNELLDFCIAKLSTDFPAQPKDIKQRVEELIGRGDLKRNADDAACLEYVA